MTAQPAKPFQILQLQTKIEFSDSQNPPVSSFMKIMLTGDIKYLHTSLFALISVSILFSTQKLINDDI